jgi:hypothetical protein
MLRLLAEHVLLSQILAAAAAMAAALTVVWAALRGERSRYRARHRSWRWSTARGHEPRHAVRVHHARHVAVAPAPSAYLGHSPDGELALVDDEHTHELIGAAA